MSVAQILASGGEIIEHAQTKQMYKCEHCEADFFGKHQLEAHMLVHTGGGLKCNVCGLLVTSFDGLRKHLRTHTGEKPYSCDVCGRSFSQVCSVINHKRVHTKERPFVCGDCGARYTQVGNLRRHQLSHTGEKLYECPDCHNRFTEKASLKRHLLVHTGERPYTCDTCGCSFRNRVSMISHKRTIHKPDSNINVGDDENSFACKLCDKKFDSLHRLNPHMASHAGKGFQCKKCGKKFAQERWYLRHVTIHDQRRNLLECHLCQRTFKSRNKLVRHQIVHTGERPYPCTECGARFGTKTNLQIHERIHTGEKPYTCHICGDAFSAKGNMTRHVSFHYQATTVKVQTDNETAKEFFLAEDGDSTLATANLINAASDDIDVDVKPDLDVLNVTSITENPTKTTSPVSLVNVGKRRLKNTMWNYATSRPSFWKRSPSTVDHRKRRNSRKKVTNSSGFKSTRYNLRYRQRFAESPDRLRPVKSEGNGSPNTKTSSEHNDATCSNELRGAIQPLVNQSSNFVKSLDISGNGNQDVALLQLSSDIGYNGADGCAERFGLNKFADSYTESLPTRQLSSVTIVPQQEVNTTGFNIAITSSSIGKTSDSSKMTYVYSPFASGTDSLKYDESAFPSFPDRDVKNFPTLGSMSPNTSYSSHKIKMLRNTDCYASPKALTAEAINLCRSRNEDSSTISSSHKLESIRIPLTSFRLHQENRLHSTPMVSGLREVRKSTASPSNKNSVVGYSQHSTSSFQNVSKSQDDTGGEPSKFAGSFLASCPLSSNITFPVTPKFATKIESRSSCSFISDLPPLIQQSLPSDYRNCNSNESSQVHREAQGTLYPVTTSCTPAYDPYNGGAMCNDNLPFGNVHERFENSNHVTSVPNESFMPYVLTRVSTERTVAPSCQMNTNVVTDTHCPLTIAAQDNSAALPKSRSNDSRVLNLPENIQGVAADLLGQCVRELSVANVVSAGIASLLSDNLRDVSRSSRENNVKLLLKRGIDAVVNKTLNILPQHVATVGGSPEFYQRSICRVSENSLPKQHWIVNGKSK